MGLETNNNSLDHDDGSLEKEFVLGAKYSSSSPQDHNAIHMVNANKGSIPVTFTPASIASALATSMSSSSASTPTMSANQPTINGNIGGVLPLNMVKTEPPDHPQDLTTLTDFPGFGFKFGIPDMMMQQMLPLALTSSASSAVTGSDVHSSTTALAAMLANHGPVSAMLANHGPVLGSTLGSSLGLPVSSEQSVITPSAPLSGSAAASLAMLNAAANAAAMSAVPSMTLPPVAQPGALDSGLHASSKERNSPLPAVCDILNNVTTSSPVDSTS